MTTHAKRLITVICTFFILVMSVSGGFAQEAESETQVITGSIDDSAESKSYPVELEPGEAIVVTADATSGDLDPVIYLYAPDDAGIAASNDDRSDETLDSALGYISVTGGSYTLEITRYEGTNTSGDYRIEITTGGPEILDVLQGITRIQLSGEMLSHDTEHFRIHYTLEGVDAVTEDYVDAVATAVEEVYKIQIMQLGWAPPPADGVMGGNDKFDLYLGDLIGSGEGALGYASPESIVGDNPNTPQIEENAATSYLQVENDFDDVEEGTPIQLMRATVAHEFHHAIQFGYDVQDKHNWIYEATATWMETITFPEEQDATGYVYYAYQYPELCFGTTSDPGDGQLQYGEWTFLQFATDEFGDDFALRLWESLAAFEGFDALQHTLDHYGGAPLPEVIAAYRTRNLARDYDLAELFGATVWLEEVIREPGRWTYTGEGIQELGANYFQLDLEPGVYYAGLSNDRANLQLFALGVDDEQISVFDLGRGGLIDTAPYRSMYLMVFNPIYDDEVNDCTYYDYDIDVIEGKGALIPAMRTWDARFYESLD